MPIKPGSDSILMAVCKTACLLTAQLIFGTVRFNADGQVNPYLLTDEDGNLIQTKEIHVSEKDYNRFKKVIPERERCKDVSCIRIPQASQL